MADWGTSAVESTFSAEAVSASQRETRGQRSVSSVSGGFFGIGGNRASSEYSVVGINANKVEPARQAIDAYVTAIMNQIDAINELANADSAYKSEVVQESVRNYIKKVKEYCMNLVSDMRAWSDKLKDVQNAWEEAARAMASNVDTATGSFSAGQEYRTTL